MLNLTGEWTVFPGDAKPKIWYCQMNWEQRMPGETLFPRIRNALGDRLASRMDTHQLLLADDGDIAIVHRKPDESFLDYLRAKGIRLPRIEEGSRDDHISLFKGALAVPYVVDREEEAFLLGSGCEWIGPSADAAMTLNDKINTRLLCEEHGFAVSDGIVCRSAKELSEGYRRLREEHPEQRRFVIKTPYGSSGKGLFHIRREEDMQSMLTYLGRRPALEAISLTLERWHDAVCHLNAQLFIGEKEVRIAAVTSQQTNSVGVYKGSDLLPQVPERWLEPYCREMRRLGSIAAKMGYRGVMGVDSFVDAAGRIIPVIEINARLTLVTYVLGMRHRLIELGYTRIEMQSYDFQTGDFVEFEAFLALADKGVEGAVGGDADYLIYGYHSVFDEGSRIFAYRIFVLFWAGSGLGIARIKDGFVKAVGSAKGG